MSNTIKHTAATLNTAQENVAKVQKVIDTKRTDLTAAQLERERLENLIVTGDTEAMTGIVEARALVNGLQTHLKDLNAALAGAQNKARLAEAEHLKARVEAGDIPGIMTDKEKAADWQNVQAALDRVTHPAIARAEAHNAAIEELYELSARAKELRGEQVNRNAWRYRIGTKNIGAFSTIDVHRLHQEHVENSLDRYKAPETQRAHREHLAKINEYGDWKRANMSAH